MENDSTLPQNGPQLGTCNTKHRVCGEVHPKHPSTCRDWKPLEPIGAPLPPPQARTQDAPKKILIALIQHGYCPNCGCDQWNTAGCPICPVMRQSYDFLVTAGIKEPRNYAEYMAADPINQQNMAESAPQEAGALTVKQAHTICEQLCFHVAVHGGEGNPFKGMKWDWFADLAAPELIELLRAASECGIPLPDEAKNLSDLLCPPHANLDKNNHLEPFDNCIACIRNERDELRQLLLRISTDIGQTIIEDPIKSAEGWTLLSKPVLADIAAVFEMDRRGVPLEEK